MEWQATGQYHRQGYSKMIHIYTHTIKRNEVKKEERKKERKKFFFVRTEYKIENIYNLHKGTAHIQSVSKRCCPSHIVDR